MSAFDKPLEHTSKPYRLPNGVPIDNNRKSLTVGPTGPVLLQDITLIEKLAHFDRERIPERVVHAKGFGVHGYFEVTKDMSKYTRAKVFQGVGKKTPAFTRFSQVTPERGGTDAIREPRGMATKLYTEDGNYDLVFNNIPVFFIRDGIQFPDVIHAMKRNPQSFLLDPDGFWDFIGSTEESTHATLMIFTDRGVPRSYREMHSFGNHTFKWVNEEGQAIWVKYTFLSETGIASLSQRQADEMDGLDPDFLTRDMFNHIAKGGTASWKLYVQLIPLEEAEKYRFDLFDVTKVALHGDFPLHEVGRLVLNRNVENYFAETEQVGFSPANLVPGIEPSPDPMLQARLFSYLDTQRHRLGANFTQLPINAPLGVLQKEGGIFNEMRDGPSVVTGNQGARLHFSPNSIHDFPSNPHARQLPFAVQGIVDRYESRMKEPNNFEQPRLLWQKVLPLEEKARTILNIVNHMKKVMNPKTKEKAVMNFFKVDPDLGVGIAKGLSLNLKIFGQEIPESSISKNIDELIKKSEKLSVSDLEKKEKNKILKNSLID